MSAAAFVWSPVRFFQRRLERSPMWLPALSAPLVCGVLDMSAVLILGAGNAAAARPLLAAAGVDAGALQAARFGALLTLVGYPMYFVLMTLILASADVLFKDSGRQLRLAEFTGLAFFAFVPGCLFTLGVSIFWTPPPLTMPAGGSLLDLQAAVSGLAASMNADPWLSTARIIYLFSLGWCVALTGVALAVTSGFGRPPPA